MSPSLQKKNFEFTYISNKFKMKLFESWKLMPNNLNLCFFNILIKKINVH
jgi:hypothetical protein